MTNHFFGDTAVLTRRSLRHIARSLDTIITTTIIPIAFRLLFAYVFAAAGILILSHIALAWIGIIPGSSAKSADGAVAFSYPLIFLPFISSAFVPTETMPGPVRAFAEHQPVTLIVNAIRGLFTQQPVGTDIWIALAWCVGILVVAYYFAMAAYRRKIS